MVDFDEFGPEKILEVYNPKVGMRGFIVLDNLALGPAKGGVRMTPTVSVDEVARLARAMTWKCALADLPFGGGKAGIIADDKEISPQKKKELVTAFAEAIKLISPQYYVTAPDMNMAEEEMRTIARTIGSNKACTGKPKDMGGLPHELGSTGFGVFIATRIAAEHRKIPLNKATFAVEGFGNVGWFAAKYLTEAGVRLVAVSDSRGVIYNKEGIDFEKLARAKKEQGSVTAYTPGTILPGSDIISVDADILITAAIPDLIKESDIPNIKARIIIEGSNIPMTPHVEALLHTKGKLIIPDFVANAGGVISSYVEYTGGNEKTMWKTIEEKISKNTKLVLQHAHKKKSTPREAAMELATERVRKKCNICKI